MQVGKRASADAKINSEEHHLAELEERLEMEEAAFGQRIHTGEIDPALLARIATTTVGSNGTSRKRAKSVDTLAPAFDTLFP